VVAVLRDIEGYSTQQARAKRSSIRAKRISRQDAQRAKKEKQKKHPRQMTQRSEGSKKHRRGDADFIGVHQTSASWVELWLILF
jgi:hypothetical protein